MRRLSPAAFQQARRFLTTEARPLDRALFEYHFDGASADRVAEELAAYQNADGGLGHALEPDLRTPSSSALATGIGLSILKELEYPAGHRLVTLAVAFLLHTFDEGRGVWRVVPRCANDHPHAPWWHDDDGGLAETFDGYTIIPRAQIVGLLLHYAELVPRDWLDSLTESTVTTIETVEEKAFAGGGDSLRYALELVETDSLPQHFRDRLVPRLRGLTEQHLSRDPAQWSEYCATPLKIAPDPESLMAKALWYDLQLNLDYMIDQQGPDGGWDPTWTWVENFPEAWEQAKREWRGHLTLATLTSLRAFGRL